MENKETLEEAGLNHCNMIDQFPVLNNPLFSFKEGAKWKAERMYSEEDMKIAWTNGNNYHRGSLIAASQFTFEKTIEQFKKK